MGITEIATLTGEIRALLGTVIPIVVQIRKIGNGQGTILHYVPSQLVGIYFEEA